MVIYHSTSPCSGCMGCRCAHHSSSTLGLTTCLSLVDPVGLTLSDGPSEGSLNVHKYNHYTDRYDYFLSYSTLIFYSVEYSVDTYLEDSSSALRPAPLHPLHPPLRRLPPRPCAPQGLINSGRHGSTDVEQTWICPG